MYEKLCDLKIQTRLFLMVSIAVAGFLFMASIVSLRDNSTATNAKNFHELAWLAPIIGQMIHELQKERGASTMYVKETASEGSKKILWQQKSNTDIAIKNFTATSSHINNNSSTENLRAKLRTATLLLDKLEDTRQEISSLTITKTQMTFYYTDTIRQLLAVIHEMRKFSVNMQLTEHLLAYESYMEAKERAGQERALGTIIFNTDTPSPRMINKFLALIAQQESYLHIFAKNASPDSTNYADQSVSGPTFHEYFRLRDIAINSIITGTMANPTAAYWFEAITGKIDQMKLVEDYLAKELVTHSQDVENTASTRFFIILIASLAATLIIISIAFVIAHSIIHPLGNITKAMHVISSGDMEYVVPHKEMHNAIGAIARALCIFRLKVIENIALEKEAQQQQKKDEERKRLVLEIEKSEKARKELELLKDRAETANRAKNEFLANISHELRTPLNAIIGFSDVMRLKMLGNYKIDRYREYATDINDSAIHLLQIINDIIDLSNVESKKIQLSFNEVSLEEIIPPVISSLTQRMQDKGLNFRVNNNNLENIILKVDKRRFKKIFLNLLSNAIKFTLSGSDIEIRVNACEKKGLSLVIRDTGIGMNPDDIPKALSPFSQLDSSFNRQYDGTGVGLPLAKKLIELHDGSFRLTSQFGVGTTAIIQLPPSRLLLNETQQSVTG